MIADDHIRSWWDSLDPEARHRIREVVQGGEIQVDPEALPQEVSSCLQTTEDNSDRVTARLVELNSLLDSVRTCIEMAVMTYFEMDSEVETYLKVNEHRIENLTDSLWTPLGEPIRVMKLLERRLHSLDGLLKKMEMAVDPNPTSQLEDHFEWAMRTGRDEMAGLITEALQQRAKYVRSSSG